MDPVKPTGASPVDLELGPIPEAAHSLRVGDAEYRDAWTAQQMHEERERCYALGVAAERERFIDALADACVAAEIPDSKFESLLIALRA